jgi:hypothetical protein
MDDHLEVKPEHQAYINHRIICGDVDPRIIAKSDELSRKRENELREAELEHANQLAQEAHRLSEGQSAESIKIKAEAKKSEIMRFLEEAELVPLGQLEQQLIDSSYIPYQYRQANGLPRVQLIEAMYDYTPDILDTVFSESTQKLTNQSVYYILALGKQVIDPETRQVRYVLKENLPEDSEASARLVEASYNLNTRMVTVTSIRERGNKTLYTVPVPFGNFTGRTDDLQDLTAREGRKFLLPDYTYKPFTKEGKDTRETKRDYLLVLARATQDVVKAAKQAHERQTGNRQASENTRVK